MAYRIESSDTETLSAAATTYAVNHGTHASGDLILDTVWAQSSGSSTISLGKDAGTLSAATDKFTYTGGNYFDDGIQVQFTGTIGSLTAGTHYFVRDLDTGAKTFKVALTSGGAAIVQAGLTAQGYTTTRAGKIDDIDENAEMAAIK